MLLSLDILAYDLRDEVAECDIRSSRRTLAYASMAATDDARPHGTLSCRQEGDDVLCRCESGSLRFRNGSLASVLCSLGERFRFYDDWHFALVKTLLDEPDWQAAVDVLYPVLDNPLYIVDRTGRMLGVSKQHLKDPITPLWLECAESRMLVGEAFQKMRIFPLHGSAEIVLPNDAARVNYLQCPLFPRDPYSCVLYVLEWKHPLSERDVHLANAFQELTRELRGGRNFTSIARVFERILRGESDDVSVLDWSIVQLGWQGVDSFCLLGLCPFDKDESRIDPFKTGFFTKMLPPHVHMHENDCTLLVVPQSDLDRVLSLFMAEPSARRWSCAVSSVFSDWGTLPERFEEIRRILPFASRSGLRTLRWSDGRPELIKSVLADMLRSPEMRHPAIDVLAQYDDSNHAELLVTLYAYLRCERKVVQAADELGIHRNTLVYRLQIIEKLLDADWDRYFDRFYFLLSYEAYCASKE